MGACQAGGSVIDWTMRREGVSFPHAVELLRDGVAPTPVSGSQLAQALSARDRRDGLRACGRLLLTRLSWAAWCVRGLGVDRSAGAGELLDREILVVALEHPSRNAGE
jgi:hypothetical protein